MSQGTPNSDLSLYFDASSTTVPDKQHMADSNAPLPVPGSYQLSDEGPVPTHVPAHTPLVQHPNGSEGWLPTENPPPGPPKAHSQISSPLLNTKANDSGFDTATNTNNNAEYGNTAIPNPVRRTASVSSSPRNADDHTDNTTTNDEGLPRRVNATANDSLGRSASGRSTSRHSVHTASDGRILSGSAFVNGAGATGPFSTAEEDEEQTARAKEASAGLTPKQRSKIKQDEVKNNQRLSKIIRSEAKTEKKSLAIAIDELDGLQQQQKKAIKSEAGLQAIHTKHTTALKKTEAAYLSAKIRFEAATAELAATGEALEVLRANSRETTQKMQDKSAEVDSLRKTLAVDEREREVKLVELNGKKRGLWN